ncbi:hypothetical protein DB346_03280 [Verrucomicrobia bacterium LW23]|nr:hypothetical protein DB346_03280 [Verrucomicrobia bacterium LW23]
MPEKQNVPGVTAGELTNRFVHFINYQFKSAIYVLGMIPGQPMAPHLPEAKMIIDQLEMLREKTRGNLNKVETKILDDAIEKLSMAFTQASGGTPPSMMPSPTAGMEQIPDDMVDEDEDFAEDEEPQAKAPAAAATPAPAQRSAPAAAPEPPENKKKFSKTYG